MLKYRLDSRRTWRLRGLHQDYLLTHSSGLGTYEARLRRVPEARIMAELDCWLSNPSTARTLYEVCEALTGRGFFNSVRIQPTQEPWHLQSTLRAALRSGRLVALDEPWSDSGRPAVEADMGVLLQQTSSLVEVMEDLSVEISLEEEDGHPIANEPYRLVCADGSVREGKLNGAGQAREEEVPRGMCTLTFPKLTKTRSG
jgi:hypothetical protein